MNFRITAPIEIADALGTFSVATVVSSSGERELEALYNRLLLYFAQRSIKVILHFHDGLEIHFASHADAVATHLKFADDTHWYPQYHVPTLEDRLQRYGYKTHSDVEIIVDQRMSKLRIGLNYLASSV